MTFGYIGYIWTLLGCALFSLVFGASALFLYGMARKHREVRGAPKVGVETVQLRAPAAPRGPRDAA